jgi:hypothetical protein
MPENTYYPNQHFQPNELRPEVLSTAGMNPWPGHDSSSRVQMFASSHLSQALVIEGATPRRTLTGVEREFGKATFKIRMPCNATVIKVIEKYPKTHGAGSIKSNPLTIVIYEDNDTRELGILRLPRYSSHHQHFGFKYKYLDAAKSKLYPGGHVARNTVIADSPAITDDGDYCYGVDTQVAFMSLPGVIEDAVIASRSYLKKLQSRGIESRTASWGKQWYPLNLYGNEEEYKPFPDIGDKIRDDGLLFALRRYDDMLSPVEMTPKALREPDYTFDQKVYAVPGATVCDIVVRHDGRLNPPPTPSGMEHQTERYYNAASHFYDELLKVYNEQKRLRKDTLRISPDFQQLLGEALMDKPDPARDKSTHMYQRVPLDDWRVEVHFEYNVLPDVGFKLTDCHGGKGIICSVWDDEDMPVDQWGNRAELIMDGVSTVKRMNLGRMYEHYLNAASAQISNEVRRLYAKSEIKYAWDYVLRYYQICSPMMYEDITSSAYRGSPEYHIQDIVKNGIYLYLPTNNPAVAPDIIRTLRREYPVNLGPVTYRGRSGQMRTTKEPVMIASLYVMLLEKTGVDWSGVASAKLSHHGIPARMTNRDKYSAPGRNQPVRLMGEDEGRLFSATIGPDATAEIMEQSNNPLTHKHIVSNLLHSKTPTNIDVIVDRSVVPRGQSRPIVLVNHMLKSGGFEFVYYPADTMPPTVYTGPNTKTEEPVVESREGEDDDD